MAESSLPPQLMTVAEVAACLRIEPKRVYELPIRKVHVGRRVRYRAADVTLYIAEHDDAALRRAG